MRWLALAIGLLPAWPAAADMYPDASNAALPQALNNLAGNATGHTYYANAYGSCTWDATGDVGPCINLAIAAALQGHTQPGGGGRVVLPAGEFGLQTTITQTEKKGVPIAGAGGAGNYGVCGTSLKWTGASGGTMVALGSDAITTNVVGAGLSDICFDGNGIAGTGIKLRSVNRGTFARTWVRNVTSRAWDIDVGAVADIGVDDNVFIQNNINLSDAPALNADGWFIGPGTATTSNTHHNTWYSTHVQHKNGRGFVVGSADSNVVYGYFAQNAGGTGKSLEFLGANPPLAGAYNNSFLFAEPQGGTTARGTTSFTTPSRDNSIELNPASGAPTPVVEAGASLNFSVVGSYRSEPKRIRVNTFGGSMTVTLTEQGEILTNTTAGGDQAVTLPKATPGLHYCVHADAVQHAVNIDPADTIRRGGITGAAGAAIGISPGGLACFVAYAAGKWQMYGDAVVVRTPIAQLPTCNSFAEGRLYGVSDANSAVFNAAVAAGGANHVMAYCDGTGWKVH